MREHHYLVTYRVRASSEHLLYKIKVEEYRVTPVLQADSNPGGSTFGEKSLNQFQIHLIKGMVRYLVKYFVILLTHPSFPIYKSHKLLKITYQFIIPLDFIHTKAQETLLGCSGHFQREVSIWFSDLASLNRFLYLTWPYFKQSNSRAIALQHLSLTPVTTYLHHKPLLPHQVLVQPIISSSILDQAHRTGWNFPPSLHQCLIGSHLSIVSSRQQPLVQLEI